MTCSAFVATSTAKPGNSKIASSPATQNNSNPPG
jgi:hypothetical protein